ncbi:putative poly(beta-D-mannuronate) O-acetylase [Lachnospiraceae bacterium TWA4]|nr:putative poly(beta-D-mannuronate) O-acetylase [Lachnospiraceae bacterium TWA4]
MVFSSFTFLLLFLPIVSGGYYLCKKNWIQNSFLLLASLVFYAWEEPIYLFFLLGSIVVNWTLGLLINKFHTQWLLALACVLNVAVLALFKYSNRLDLPLGISFYTFQALSYLIDVYRKEVSVQKNFLDFALYISMFPQLIAGPIVCYKEIEKQLQQRAFDLESMAYGLIRFIYGLSKKVLLANNAGKLWEEIFAQVLTGGDILLAWIGIIFFAFQIYFDFSGYSDMAIGLGKFFGFSFPENFNYPYMAKSITEFWRRWHMTLSLWFRNYVYIPLGGSRKGKLRMIFNLLIVWSLTGMWHGAGLNFLLWGLYFFILLVIRKVILKKVI